MKEKEEITKSEDMDEREKSLMDSFNRMSWLDRKKLGFAGELKAMSGIARDDTKTHPYKYPLYAAYMGAFISPLPYVVAAVAPVVLPFLAGLPLLMPAICEPLLMGVRFVANIATGGLLKSKLTPWTRWTCERMKEAVKPAVLMESHMQFLEPDQCLTLLGEPEKLRVKNWELAKDTLRQAWSNSHEATKTFGHALCAVFHKKAAASESAKAPENPPKPVVP